MISTEAYITGSIVSAISTIFVSIIGLLSFKIKPKEELIASSQLTSQEQYLLLNKKIEVINDECRLLRVEMFFIKDILSKIGTESQKASGKL